MTNDEPQPAFKWYKKNIRCMNCEDTDDYEIPLGTKVMEYMMKTTCDTCGCFLAS